MKDAAPRCLSSLKRPWFSTLVDGNLGGRVHRRLLVVVCALVAGFVVSPAAANAAVRPSVTYGADTVILGTTVSASGQQFRLLHTWVGMPGAAPICHYDFQRWIGGDPVYAGGHLDQTWKTKSTSLIDRVSTTSVADAYSYPGTYWYRVRAVDCAGHFSAWANDEGNSPYALETTAVGDGQFRYDPHWLVQKRSTATSGRLHLSNTPGATATLNPSVDICDNFYWEVGVVAEKSPAGGIMGIYFGGVLIDSVNLYSKTTSSPTIIDVLAPGDLACPTFTENLSIINLSPAESPKQQVTIDGLVLLGNIQTANPH